MKHFFNWLRSRVSPGKASDRPDLRQTGAHKRPIGAHLHQSGARPRPRSATQTPPAQPEYVNLEPSMEGHIEELGPGKNVLIRNKYVREDTGTHDTLKILDDSMIDTQEETGIDPYNTGQFDRSKNWDKRFRN